MLSGFVLGYNYFERYAGFYSFFRARALRIYPAYFLGVLLCLPLFQYVDAKNLMSIILMNVFLVQAWYPNLWGFWHHGGTWSISVELFLYAGFPLFLPFKQVSAKFLWLMVLGCWVFASSFVPSLWLNASTDVIFPVFYAIPIY
ncbi:MAG: acyltransferase family protein, partial [Neisseriaceae bacterium]|nr:acyltransferase family protein [Neisseriaceae bacterium]